MRHRGDPRDHPKYRCHDPITNHRLGRTRYHYSTVLFHFYLPYLSIVSRSIAIYVLSVLYGTIVP